MKLEEAVELVYKYYPGESRTSIHEFLESLYGDGYYITCLDETKGKEGT